VRPSTKGMLVGAVFLAPNLLGFLIFHGLPILAGLYLSFTQWDLLSSPTWVGFDNYRDLLRDDLMWTSLRNTAYYSLITIPGGMAISLALALAIKQTHYLATVYRSLYFLPVVTSTIAVALIWKSIFNTDFVCSIGGWGLWACLRSAGSRIPGGPWSQWA